MMKQSLHCTYQTAKGHYRKTLIRPFYSYMCLVVVRLIRWNVQSSEVSIKTRSTPASLSFIGQVTKHTTVKWSIVTRFPGDT